MSLQLKPGVRLTGLSPQMVLAALIVGGVYERHTTLCTITSGNDSAHGANSLHYRGNALDFRTKNYVGNKGALAFEIKEALGENYDVVLESLGTDNEHLHVEYQPK